MDGVFSTLGDPTRRRILHLLRSGDLTAGEIAEHFSLAKSTVSGHLKALKASDLVVIERSGSTITYSLNVAVHEEMLAAIFTLLHVGEKEMTFAPTPTQPQEEL